MSFINKNVQQLLSNNHTLENEEQIIKQYTSVLNISKVLKHNGVTFSSYTISFIESLSRSPRAVLI